MIKFNCKSCGQKFSVPESSAGKKGKCPRCKNIVVVPEIQATSSVTEQSNSEDTKTSSKSSTYDSALLDMPQKDKIQDLALSQAENPEKTVEHEQELEEESAEKPETAAPVQRKLPWLIDIFFYPLSISGTCLFCRPGFRGH